ncbi:MAG TPA: dihydrolipoyl dehydrogenase [Parachlamydiaceae bacterium]|nr:dihydrolipoyl dehydrogenase [Parachlamydiaceae bacterium]
MNEKNKRFDIAVIGSGPGGYPAAIKAAQNGKTVALIEARETGGTCLNRGCIPSKTLIANAEVLHKIQEAEDFGITVGSISFDYSKMVDRKDGVVSQIRKSLEGLIASNKITMFKGYGKLTSPKTIKITGTDNIEITADQIIIATGSEPRNIAAFPCDGKKIHDSTTLLEMRKLPKKIAIIGGGVIGCEFASLFAILGVEVTILEMLPRIIPMEGESVSAALTKAFKNKGIAIETGVAVESIDTSGKGVKVQLAGGKCITADIALVSVGRKLNTSDIGLEKAGVLVLDNGMVAVNDRMETSTPGIYAIGDIASKWWLAHVATHQGIIAASNATGHPMRMDYNSVPSVIYTSPEIATVGMSLEQALEKGYKATVGSFPFQALGKSQAALQTDGFAQIVLDKATGQVLGAQVVGHEASTMIAEMTIVITNELTLECITETIHAHPTISEAWMEAAFLGEEAPLHWPPKPGKKAAN